MKKHGFKIADLRYWLRHKPEGEVKLRLIPDLAVAKILDEIRKAFTLITVSRPAKEITIYHIAKVHDLSLADIRRGLKDHPGIRKATMNIISQGTLSF